MSNVINLGEYRVRAHIRRRKPARIAEPIALDPDDPVLEVKYPCAYGPCDQLVDKPGMCRSCRAEHAAARIVRGPYRRET